MTTKNTSSFAHKHAPLLSLVDVVDEKPQDVDVMEAIEDGGFKEEVRVCAERETISAAPILHEILPLCEVQKTLSEATNTARTASVMHLASLARCKRH